MFTCQTEDLIRTLDKVVGAIERSAIQPILEHVLVSVEEDSLTLLAADNVTHVRAQMPLKKGSRKAEQFCVAGGKLGGVLRSMISKSVSCKVTGSTLHIQPAGDGADDDRGWRLSIRAGEEFPRENVSHKPVTEIELDQARMLESIGRLMPAVATEMHRQYLTGMYFDFAGETLRLVATDGHRMAVDELAQIKTDEPFGIIVPRKAMELLRRVLAAEAEAPVRMQPLADEEGSNAAVRFEIPGVRITATLINATYPDYMKVLPTDHDATAVFVQSDLHSVLSQVATVLDRGNDAVTVSMAAGNASLSARGAQTNDEAALDLAVEYDGSERANSFNCNYLTDMLKAFEERERIRIMFQQERESVLCETVDAKEEDTLKYVLMPIKI